MADRPTQLAAFKLAANNYQARLETAATKKDALNCAIGAADSLIKALKLSSNPDEKKALKAQFTTVADAADRIKTTKVWSPPPQPQAPRQRTKSDMIGQWAVDVSQTVSPQSPPVPAYTAFAQKTEADTPLPTSPSVASYSHIRRLPEPVSTRKRTKKEEIVLLKASVIDGFKCPPWDRPPVSTEFLLTAQAEAFV
jgi:calpain-7